MDKRHSNLLKMRKDNYRIELTCQNMEGETKNNRTGVNVPVL